MSQLIDKAIERMRQMPAERQESIARLVLHEIEEDERWMRSTDAHSEQLTRFVRQVLESDERGECEPLDPERL